MWLERINPQLNIAWSGTWQGRGYIEAARRLYDHELIIFTTGLCHVQVGRREFRCPAGTFMIIPPDTTHISSVVSTESVHRYCFHFDWIYCRRTESLPYCVFLPARPRRSGLRFAPRWVKRDLWHGKVSNPVAVTQLAEKIHERWTTRDRTGRLTGRAQLLELLLLLLSRQSALRRMDRQGDLAGRAKQLLDERYAAHQSIQDLLEQSGFSYAHLSRIFKKQYGISPLSYVNAVRIERAKSLLLKGSESVKSVASASGFDDPAYFSRLFRKTAGISPSSFAAHAEADVERKIALLRRT
jgi:AraC-like DNA-binding protein